MTDLPTAGDSGWSDPDTLGAIPPVVAVTYCGHCGTSANKGNHVLCHEELAAHAPTFCTTCRRTLTVTTEGTTFAAIAVVWFTESVSFTMTVDGLVVPTVCDCGKRDAPAAAARATRSCMGWVKRDRSGASAAIARLVRS